MDRLYNARGVLLEVIATRDDGQTYLPLMLRVEEEIQKLKDEKANRNDLLAKYTAEYSRLAG